MRAHCAVSQAWPSRVTGLAQPCRSARPVVSQRTPGRVAAHARLCHAPCCSLPSCVERIAGRIVSFPRPCRACLAIQPNDQATFLSRYNLLPQQLGPRACAARPCARAGRVVGPLSLVVGRVLSHIVAQSGRVLAVSWAWLLCLACCVTIQCIVS